VFLLVTSESVDGTASAQEIAAQPPVAGAEAEEMEGAGSSKEEGGGESKVVFIGSDVDRTWTQYFDVVEVASVLSLPPSPSSHPVQVAAEILANMACLVKNTVLSSAQEDEDEEEWSDDEESELKMEQIASGNGSVSQHPDSLSTPVSDVSTESPATPSLH
jgi:hypothetical protein